MYGARCRFIHSDCAPEDEYVDSNSSTSSESEDVDALKDLTVNPYGDGQHPIDFSTSFGGLKQVTLTPLTSVGSSFGSPPDIDNVLFKDPFVDFKLGGSEWDSSSSTSSILDSLDPPSPRSVAESIEAKFSRLSIFQHICREPSA